MRFAVLQAAARMQLQSSRADSNDLFPLLNVPFFTVIFLAIVQSANRPDLRGYAVLAPVLLNLWQMALFLSGDLVARDRWNQTLDLLVATPSSYAVIGAGRICTTTVVSLLAFGEAWLVARIGFGFTVPIRHADIFAATLLVTALATVGTALVLSALFAVGRTSRIYQNTLSYPFYVLGGVLVPVGLLPGVVQVPARLFYLSWASDLFRDCLQPRPVEHAVLRLLAVAVLGLAGFAVGGLLTHRIIDRLRSSGRLGLA